MNNKEAKQFDKVLQEVMKEWLATPEIQAFMYGPNEEELALRKKLCELRPDLVPYYWKDSKNDRNNTV